MKARAVLLMFILVVPVFAMTSANAAPSAHVFAGETTRGGVGEPVALAGVAEGFDGTPTAVWNSPDECTVLDPDSLATSATCAEVGAHAFTLTVSDGIQSASDTVSIIVYRDSVVRIASAAGHVVAGAPDETWNYRTGTGLVDAATVDVPVVVPAGTVSMSVRLAWDSNTDDFDLDLYNPDGRWMSSADGRTRNTNAEVVAQDGPVDGEWTAKVMPFAVVDANWTLTVDARVIEGAGLVAPTIAVESVAATAGESVVLTATVANAAEPYTLAWETTGASYRFDDGVGETFAFTFQEDTWIKARVVDADGLSAIAYARVATPKPHPVTVVAVIDNGFNPYHYDFVAHQHPWNRDSTTLNDFDFTRDPATYIDGFPGAERVDITIPTTPGTDVGALHTADADEWSKIKRSTSRNDVKLYWLPDTKVVAAASFTGNGVYASNSAHGTRSAASAAGNWHGTCQECVFVLLEGLSYEALRWAVAQSWIDVVTNSWGSGLTVGLTQGIVRDNIAPGGYPAETKAAVDRGQTVVFSAGNGLVNAFTITTSTYTTGTAGPDWMVTVGAVTPTSHQSYTGSSTPVDIASVGSSYPSTGGSSANGTGTHSGTSNAAPVIAGYFAKAIQVARESMGDLTVQHADGIIASGTPVPCGAANPDCPLGDGILTRKELHDTIYHNVYPTPQRISTGTFPTTEYAYYYQGHGTLVGHMDGEAVYQAEVDRLVDALHGAVAPYERPKGEKNWMTVDSRCRQLMWGTWDGGYWTGGQPELDPVEDPVATFVDSWCSKPAFFNRWRSLY